MNLDANPPARRHRWLAVVLGFLLLAALAGAACGGSGGSVSADPTREGLRETGRAAAVALIEKPTDGYEYFSAACKDSVSRSDFAAQMLFANAMFEGFFGFALNEMKVSDVEVVDFDGTTGSVRVTVTGPDGEDLGAEDEPEKWRYEDGRWVSDDCDEDILGGDDRDNADTAESALPRADFEDGSLWRCSDDPNLYTLGQQSEGWTFAYRGGGGWPYPQIASEVALLIDMYECARLSPAEEQAEKDAVAERERVRSVGESADVGNWTVVVNSIEPSTEVESYDDCSGCVGLAINVTATYNGTDRGVNAGMDLTAKYIGADRVIYTDGDCMFGYESSRKSFFSQNDVVNGGTMTGDFCLVMPTAAVGAGLIYIEETYTFDDAPGAAYTAAPLS
jgi:hypothetical protein